MRDIMVTLTDASGKRKTFELYQGKQLAKSRPIHTERGFGFTHTSTVEIEGRTISADIWRFFEGTLGVDALYQQLNSERFIDSGAMDTFIERFQKTSTDGDALEAWNLLMTEISNADTAEQVAAESTDAMRQ